MREEHQSHLHRKKSKIRKVLKIAGIVIGICFLLYGILWYIIDLEVHPRKITKFKPSAHYLSNRPAHGETISTSGEVTIYFDYPLTDLTTVSITAGDWEDSVGNRVISVDRKSVSHRLKADARNAIYTVNYTACFIDDYCDYGYFQFRLDKTPQK